jgi:hypothetical protein
LADDFEIVGDQKAGPLAPTGRIKAGSAAAEERAAIGAGELPPAGKVEIEGAIVEPLGSRSSTTAGTRDPSGFARKLAMEATASRDARCPARRRPRRFRHI